MTDTGIITTFESGVDLVVEWKIENFFSLPEMDGEWYESPHFSFGGEIWHLYISPNGSSRNYSSGHVDLELFIYLSAPSIKQSFSLSLKTAKGEKYNERHFTKDFDNDNLLHDFNRFIPRLELIRRRSDLVPGGTLTVICKMKSSISAECDSNMPSACCHCKKSFDAEILSSHQRKCMHRPVKCPDCLEIVVLQKWLEEHECEKENPEEGKKERKKILKRKQKKRKKILNTENCNKANSECTCVDVSTQTGEEDGATSTTECPHCKLTLEAASMLTQEKSCTARPMKCSRCGEVVATNLWLDHDCLIPKTNAVGKLLQDLKRIMVSGDHSDVTISVRGEEIRLHGSILRARNNFFDSRPNNESHESTPDALTINDSNPNQFCTLIHYIYTGTVDKICPENVCGLYDVAVTCQEQQMKAECLQLMMNTLSVDNFCDYTALAVKHEQEELLQKTTELFARKAKQITRHKKWKAFLESYPAQANKLFMKALDQYDEK